MGVTADRRAKADPSSHESPPPPQAADERRIERRSSSSSSSSRGDGSSSSREITADTAMQIPSPFPPVQGRLLRKAGCAKGEEFAISSRSFPLSEGCYSHLTQYNEEAMYSPSRDNGSSNYVMGATLGAKNDPDDLRWSLVYADSGNTKESFSLCQSVQSASTTHPANAMWACDLSGDGELVIVNKKNFSVTCGCSSPAGGTYTRLDPPTSSVTSRTVGCGVIFVFGVVSLCCALSLKMAGGPKKPRQPPRYVRVGTEDDSL